MARPFRDGDTGMDVLSSDGEKIGTVQEVHGDTVHVKPEHGIADSIRQRLGWEDESEDMYALSHDRVRQFSGNEIHLKD
ncbi:hypothetical protein [Halobacterium rubrum]|uniref:hypothetical protein n=1 Tax=Halobacterium TaxID=2239 RepID=UPI001F34BF5C|nr:MULTISPECIES: hypothetical protein [Halobacterium]MDH5021288.1 hypothetical protein [Halobacterium rubrum]